MTGPFAFCGIGVCKGANQHIALSTATGIQANPDTMFRAASVSKVIVGQAAAALVKSRYFCWDEDVSDILGWRWKPRPFPTHITLRGLLSHTSGLTDDAGYLISPDITLEAWQSSRDLQTNAHDEFIYCNLGYIFAAAVLEALTDKPFPDAVAAFLPANAGFNWSGVSDAVCENRLPTYRRLHGGFLPQVDKDIAAIPTGCHPGIYSPHGGLRVSMRGLLDIAGQLCNADTTCLWADTYGAHNGWGPGIALINEVEYYPHPLIGHFGNAYGFRGGVWYDTARDISFAYALNGYPFGDDSEDITDEERLIFSAIAKL